ncbi:uncharacterized protein LOC143526887 isoform X2 [Brachyhypopomus gauderio]|uniref:uncharacterized protein LOC143526887 isoform X2 n=1 Tax=Brachyhypopomus gauderio TaxID=698409 RepID=UPI00404209EB
MPSGVPLELEDLRVTSQRLTSRGLTFAPRVSSVSRTPSGHFQMKNALKSDFASSVQSVADENLTLADIESMLSQKVEGRQHDLKAAFRAFDQEDRGTVTKGEFRRVIESFLVPLTQSQFKALLAKVPKRRNGTILYMKFLQQYCPLSSTLNRITSVSAISQSWAFEKLLCRLKEKIGGNLKTITRAFRLFDYNRDGQIQQHELKRVLESYCFPMSQQEFHRLWSHYSPKNSHTLSYKEFLERLGADCEKYQDSPKLDSNLDVVKQSRGRPKRRQSRTTAWTSSPETGDTLDEIHEKFVKKMSVNHASVEKALQACDIIGSGVVSRDDLRAVVSNYLFPIEDSNFLSLLSRFGLNSVEYVNWRKFMSLCREEEQILPAGKDTGASTPDLTSIKEILPRLQQHIFEVYPLLKKSFLLFDEKRSGLISRGDMRRILQELTFSLTDEQFRGLMDLVHVPPSGGIPYMPFIDFFRKKELTERQQQSSKVSDLSRTFTQPSTTIATCTEVEGIPKASPKTCNEDQKKKSSFKFGNFMSAEDCFSQLEKRIKECHGNVLTAFLLMDTNKDRLVNWKDFRVLFDSIHFNTKETEYQKLLDMMGLKPNCTLNYHEFYSKVVSAGRARAHPTSNIRADQWFDSGCEQVHAYLEARAGSPELSKAFGPHGKVGENIITKNGLKHFLYKCGLHVAPYEFEKTWARYDEIGKGYITYTEFLDKMNVMPQEFTRAKTPAAETLHRTACITPLTETTLHKLREWLQLNCEDVSKGLVALDKGKDGHVTLMDLRALLCRNGFQIDGHQLLRLLNSLGIDISHNKLLYLHFLKRISGTVVDGRSVVASPVNPSLGTQVPGESAKALSPERALQSLLPTSSDTVSKAFAAFDKTGNGKIAQCDFRRVLDHLCVRVSDVQYRKLLSKLSVRDGEADMVDWKKFLQTFDLCKKETSEEWAEKVQKARFPNQACPLPIGDILLRIQEVVSARLCIITKEMVDLDYARNNEISKEDFRNVCDHHFLRLTDDQFEKLWKILPVNVFDNLDYREFLKKFSRKSAGGSSSPDLADRLENSTNVTPRHLKTAYCTPEQCKPRCPSMVCGGSEVTLLQEREAMERRLRFQVLACWKEIQRKCREADKERTGQLSTDVFLGILKDLRINLSESQFEHVLKNRNITSKGRTSYLEFLQHCVLMLRPQTSTGTNKLKLHIPRTLVRLLHNMLYCYQLSHSFTLLHLLSFHTLVQLLYSFKMYYKTLIFCSGLQETVLQNLQSLQWFWFCSGFVTDTSGVSEKRSIRILRDTGAAQTLMLDSILPLSEDSYCGCDVLIQGIKMGVIRVPLHKVCLEMTDFKGEVKVAVRPTLPISGIDLILGNDVAGGRLFTLPEVVSEPQSTDLHPLFPACVLTRAQSKKYTDVIDLSDTFMAVAKPAARGEKVEERSPEKDGATALHLSMSEKTFSRSQLAAAQRADVSLEPYRTVATDSNAERYFFMDGLLMRKWSPPNAVDDRHEVHQVVVPVDLRPQVLALAHDHPCAGHFGVRKTLLHLLKYFYWPTVKSDVAEYCRTCHTCQLVGKPNQKIPPAPLRPIAVTGNPFDHIIIDCVGPLPKTRTGYSYLLTLMCAATRFPEAIPLRSLHTRSVVKALVKFCTTFGLPKVIQSDQGSNFTSRLFAQVMRELKIKHQMSSAYHPESQGALVRFHQTFKTMLRSYCLETEKDWDEGIPLLLFAIREAVQESTGFTPSELVFGHVVRGPLKALYEQWLAPTLPAESKPVGVYVRALREKMQLAHSMAKKALVSSQSIMKTRYDKKAVLRSFEVGDQVLALLPIVGSPLKANFSGPYNVKEKVDDTTYVITTPDRKRKTRVCHINLLKFYKARTPVSVTPTCNATPVSITSPPTLADYSPEMDNIKLGIYSLPCARLPNSEALALLDAKLVDVPHFSQDIKKMIKDYPSLFTDTPGRTTVLEHDIDVSGHAPIKQHPYRVNPRKRTVLSQETPYLVENGLAIPSRSPWSSPCLLVPKPDGTHRLCTDFRKVNAITTPDSFPLPRLEDCIDRVGSAKIVTKLDLLKGYWQVPLTKRASDISAFSTPDAFLQYTVMPFGLRNAPATFQRLMNLTLGDVKNCVAYLDDIVIYTETWEHHLEVLDIVFRRLHEASLVLNLEKCEFGRAVVSYLGKMVGQGHVKPLDAKVQAIAEFPVPTTRRELRRFLGMAGYYRCFCKNFAVVVAPLTNLLRKNALFSWSHECDAAFRAVRLLLSSSPVLAAPKTCTPFKLEVDASDTGVGAVLLQEGDDTVDHPVCYFSKKFLKHQLAYSTIEKEALALMLALQHFEVYLGDSPHPILVFTDHNPLVFVQRMCNKNQRLMRWSLILQSFNLSIQHKKGTDNVVADALSRC